MLRNIKSFLFAIFTYVVRNLFKISLVLSFIVNPYISLEIVVLLVTIFIWSFIVNDWVMGFWIKEKKEIAVQSYLVLCVSWLVASLHLKPFYRSCVILIICDILRYLCRWTFDEPEPKKLPNVWIWLYHRLIIALFAQNPFNSFPILVIYSWVPPIFTLRLSRSPRVPIGAFDCIPWDERLFSCIASHLILPLYFSSTSAENMTFFQVLFLILSLVNVRFYFLSGHPENVMLFIHPNSAVPFTTPPTTQHVEMLQSINLITTLRNHQEAHDLPKPWTKGESGRILHNPVLHHTVWDLVKAALGAFWSPFEIKFQKDKEEWEKIEDPDTKRFIQRILGFFAVADERVNTNIIQNLKGEVDFKEAQIFYALQEAQEAVHQISYADQIQAFIPDQRVVTRMLSDSANHPALVGKMEWINAFMGEGIPLIYRLCAFLAVEAIFFSGSFCAIFWVKHKRIPLEALTVLNAYIARDEGLHQQFATTVIRMYGALPGEVDAFMERILRSAVEVEERFVSECLPERLDGMNSDLMIQHVQSVADFVALTTLGRKLYGVETPFGFMKTLGVEGKTNFFEVLRTTEYTAVGESMENTLEEVEDF